MYTATTDNRKMKQLSAQNHRSGFVSKVSLVYDYLLASEDSIIEKNKYSILFVQHAVQSNDFEIIEKFVNDDYIFDLDISILYSISIITKQFDQLEICNSKLEELIASKV